MDRDALNVNKLDSGWGCQFIILLYKFCDQGVLGSKHIDCFYYVYMPWAERWTLYLLVAVWTKCKLHIVVGIN